MGHVDSGFEDANIFLTMIADFRILHTADSHIGADLPQRPRTGRRTRGDDFIDSFRRVLARAGEFGVDLVIHAGDLFDRSQPTQGAILAAAQPLLELAQAGIPVVIIPGNHERSILPNALFLSHELIHIFRGPQTVVFERNGLRVAVAGFPCVRHEIADLFAPTLAATGWEQARGDINILAVHQTFEGARCGPANYRFRAGEDVVPGEAVPRAFHYVAVGHVHRHQRLGGVVGHHRLEAGATTTGWKPGPHSHCLEAGGTPCDGNNVTDPAPALPNGPPIIYSGSPDRINFAEIDEPKGGVIVEFAQGRARPRFIEQQVRPMAIVPFDVTGLAGRLLLSRLLEQVAGLPQNAVVQVRLTGKALPGDTRGLGITQRIRDARPDVLAMVSAQAVEWVAPGGGEATPAANDRSAFAVLDAPSAAIVSASRERTGLLPTTRGTYALYDRAGRLLYVGKATNLRTRVQSHLRGASANQHFADWSAQIAKIEARRATSELEALLIEAELIRRHRPPFNRQMRLWERYCYLCRDGLPHGQLVICSEARGELSFGPWRSRIGAEAALDAFCACLGLALCPEDRREHAGDPASAGRASPCRRYFLGWCTGPCAGRISEDAYAERLRTFDELLAGNVPVEDVLRRSAGGGSPGCGIEGLGGAGGREELAETLEAAAARAVVLRRARELLGALLILPGTDGAKTAAVITGQGLHLRTLPADAAEAWPAWYRSLTEGTPTSTSPAVPKTVSDALTVAVHEIARQSGVCQYLPRAEALAISAEGLARWVGKGEF